MKIALTYLSLFPSLIRLPISTGFRTGSSVSAHKRTISTTLFTSTADANDTIQYQSRQKCWRPTIQDVERISWGKPAKKKGTGSRGVPHRLNEDERRLFDQSRRKGFLEIGGSGWRAERRGSPLVNSYRSLCDARGQVCITLHKGNTGSDELVVDFSPLRLPDAFPKLEKDMIRFANLPTSYEESDEKKDVVEEEVDTDEEIDLSEEDDSDDAWENRPIYQLPSYCVSWEILRSDGKALAKKLAKQFQTIEEKASKSKKPNHVKPGKNRKHGGYGIG